MVAKMKKNGAGAEAYAPSNHFSKPSWLLCTIADLDERMKMLISKIPKEDSADSFAERANAYYQKRPQLLALLQDLYNDYLSLADRYCQSLAKNYHHRSHCSSPSNFNENQRSDHGDSEEVIDSDAESSLSFQSPFPLPAKVDVEMMVADMVMNTVDYEILSNELRMAEKRSSESARKIELQKNLLDVLESERLILLNDNATLGYRLSSLAEENKGLVSESLFLKRKAAELARCLLKTREDHRVFVLSRKIEDLQGQIYGLEKRNKEYYEQLVKQDEQKIKAKKKTGRIKGQVSLDNCFKVRASAAANVKRDFKPKHGGVEGARVSKLWNRVKKMDLFSCGSCGPHLNFSNSQEN
ncbi:kinase-interacting family protein-like [Olea europaea var. sylvestris]|uniref:kinase-interacting family protein-like n=1 Tax=Olea europaea var. sylvestris TaxID=158386 RepID=UPI000C1D0610|nr:kinase-interacting family protein-like [Olea europaea var. sylvestris]XP_022889945.1 kinase-interacting family protein-like [Olea europaea var. sylvestris]